MEAEKVLQKVTEKVLGLNKNHTVRIAVDGVDCSGKTTFAHGVKDVLLANGRNAEVISIDGFHNPSVIRYGMGKDSPEGYYLKSFNNNAIISGVLEPLGPGGDGKYLKAIFDFKNDKEVKKLYHIMPQKSILLFEGVFLMRPELFDYWDLKIWLDVDFNIVKKKGYL